MAADELTIWNLALSEIGQDPLADQLGTDKTTALLTLFYPAIRDEVLAAHPWNFAMTRAVPAATTAPLFGWAFAYDLPADCLKAWRAETNTAGETPPWEVEGRTIVTDADAINLLYIAQITDTTVFAPIFTLAVAKRLAQAVA